MSPRTSTSQQIAREKLLYLLFVNAKTLIYFIKLAKITYLLYVVRDYLALHILIISQESLHYVSTLKPHPLDSRPLQRLSSVCILARTPNSP